MILEQRKLRTTIAVAALAVPVLASCSAERTTTVTRRTVVEEQAMPAPAPKAIAISIVDLHDEPTADPSREKVVGTIVNDGDERVSGLSVKLNALDGAGNVIRSITTPPIMQTIDPAGGRATFEAFMPRDPEVAGYHAVAIAR